MDTNILIDHLRSLPKRKSILRQLVEKHSEEELAISVVSIQELYEGKSTRDPAREKDLLAIIAPLKLLSYELSVATLAGKIARDLSQPIELADAAIAATTLQNQAKLLTLNKKDFVDIPGLSLFGFSFF